MLLIIGGREDHNCNRLASVASHHNVPHRVFYTDSDPAPTVSWKPQDKKISINGECFHAEGTMLFTRYDIFSTKRKNAATDQRARNNNWYDTIRGWALANREVAMLNRGFENLEVNKLRVLKLAVESGFAIPKTRITNDFNDIADIENYIAKPVSGGEYTLTLSDLVAEFGLKVSRPYIVQEKLAYPEMRLFRSGDEYFALQLQNETLDSREGDGLQITEFVAPDDIVDAMETLTDRLGLDFAAADFKTCPRTGKLVFLEVNTMPMMTGYDDVLNGYLSLSMIDALEALSEKCTSPLSFKSSRSQISLP